MSITDLIGKSESLRVLEATCEETGKFTTCPDCGRKTPVLRITYGAKESEINPTCECISERERRWYQGMREQEQRDRIERVFPTWLLGKRFQKCTFDNFITREGTEIAIKAAKEYAENFPPPNGEGMLFLGKCGTGKSHLAAAIAHEVKKKGFTTVFASVPETLSRIRATYDRGIEETEAQLMYGLKEASLVVLDDLATEKRTDWKQEIIYEMVDARYRNELPVIVTTNANPQQLKKQVGERTYDRLIEMCRVVVNNSTSYREEIGRKENG